MARTPSSLANRTRAVLALAFAWLTALAALDGFVNVRFAGIEAEASLRPVRQERPVLAILAALSEDDERHVAAHDPPTFLLAARPIQPHASALARPRPQAGRSAVARPTLAYRPTGPPAA